MFIIIIIKIYELMCVMYRRLIYPKALSASNTPNIAGTTLSTALNLLLTIMHLPYLYKRLLKEGACHIY